MTKNFFKHLMWIAAIVAAPLHAHAVTGSTYPSSILQNQFGETSINLIKGGSNQLDCSFTVDSTNANGLGISGLSGTPCAAVYMHTTQTPATGNPNPASGYIVVKLASNFYGFVNGYASFQSPQSGTNINVSSTTLTAGKPYVITSVGTTATADWQYLGLPLGLTPAAFQSFIMTGTTTVAGTGVVQEPTTTGSKIETVDLIGNPGLEAGATGGAQLILRTLAASSASVTILQPTAPLDNSVVRLRFSMLPLSTQLH